MTSLTTSLTAVLFLLTVTAAAHADDDPYAWLEEVTGKRALEFVEAQNKVTFKELEARPEFPELKKQILGILDSRDRIPYVGKMGDWYYNLWQDAANPRGLWRRCTLDEFRKPEPAWETVLDLDALAKSEKENWVWQGAAPLPPKNDRCLLSLSRGGGDAKVVREFDLNKRAFVADGFNLPEAKSEAVWRDENTIYVGTDFGPGSLTDSGYPRFVKRWTRGTPLAKAETVFECTPSQVGAIAWVDHRPGFFHEGFHIEIGVLETETFIVRDGKNVKLDVPRDADASFFRDWLTIRLRTDWTAGDKTYKSGSLLAAKLDSFLKGERKFDVLFEPGPRTSLQGVAQTRSALVLTVSENVHTRIVEVPLENSKWGRRDMKLPGKGTAGASGVDPDESNDLWVHYQDFLAPPTLYLSKVGEDPGEPIKRLPALFDAHDMEVQQLEATSADGTKVPYFIMGQRSALQSGHAPTLLYGYGGFEISLFPQYNPVIGRAWLERGRVYVLATLRGGGEFGPAWHQAAMKEHRQRAFDDFEAIAADLVKRGVTDVRHLGIMGGSNGGLLVSTVAIQRPELFHAVVCHVPLTDMRRFNHLLAGASWMGEYGDPDKPEDWAYLSKYSPYQNVKPDVKYPRILFTTSTRDDRVHPAHARKLFAKMKEMGHDVLYYENTEGGHGGAANNEQRARKTALEYAFLWEMLR